MSFKLDSKAIFFSSVATHYVNALSSYTLVNKDHSKCDNTSDKLSNKTVQIVVHSLLLPVGVVMNASDWLLPLGCFSPVCRCGSRGCSVLGARSPAVCVAAARHFVTGLYEGHFSPFRTRQLTPSLPHAGKSSLYLPPPFCTHNLPPEMFTKASLLTAFLPKPMHYIYTVQYKRMCCP